MSRVPTVVAAHLPVSVLRDVADPSAQRGFIFHGQGGALPHVLNTACVPPNVGSIQYMTSEAAITVAAYYRLSRESEDSASIETQRAAVRRWLSANGYSAADVTEYPDSGVSGAKPLEERKHMRRLMNDRPTVVVAWKLDRYARSVSEFLRLVAWAEAHNVRLATADNAINTASPTGRMVAVVLAALAEWERAMIAGRVKDGHATRRTLGRWGSGNAPFPYRTERRDGAAYLAVDEEKTALARAAIRKLLDDGTVTSTARMVGLSQSQWRRLLKSPTLRGQREFDGKLVVGEDGITPIQFGEPIISAAERKAIVTRLDDLATGKDRAPRGAAPMCAGLASCGPCGGKLNGGASAKGVASYKCQAGHVTIYADEIDQRVSEEFLTKYGSFTEYVVRLEGGNDLSDRMAEAMEQAERIASQMASAGPLMLATLSEKAEELEAVYASLRDAHDPDVREVLESTGRTLREAWEAEPEARGRMLGDVGLHVVVRKGVRGYRTDRLEISWAFGGDDQELIDYLVEMETRR